MTAEITNILSVVAWATRLSLALYDLCPTVPTAGNDIIALAREVTLIAKILRQVGDTLKQNYTIPSEDGAAALRHILSLSQRAFWEIERLTPARGRQSSEENALRITDGSSLEWSESSSNKAAYLRLYLKAVRMTTAVLVQTVCVAKATAFSSHVRQPYAYDEVRTERSHLESLIVEQQLAILRVRRCHTELSQRGGTPPSSTLALLMPNSSETLSPQDLLPFQEATLSRARPGDSDIDDISRVRFAALSYIDVLLCRWTKLAEIQQNISSLQHPGASPILGLPAPMDDRRRSQQPSVESDTESEYRRTAPTQNQRKNRLGFPGPVLLHVDDRDDYAVASPISTPLGTSPMTKDLRPPEQHLTRSMSASAVGGPPPKSILKNSLAPVNTGHINGGGSMPSSYTSPRSSFMAGSNIPTSPGLPPQFAPPPTVHAEDFAATPHINWRLLLRNEWWDHHGPTIIKTNSNAPPHPGIANDRAAATIISSEHVSRRVIDEASFECTTTQQQGSDDGNRRGRHETWHRIHHGLTFPQVHDLVRKSAVLRRRETEPRLQRSQTASAATMPTLDRSRTVPAPTPGPLLVAGGAAGQPRRARAGSNASHGTNASYISHRSTNRSVSPDSDSDEERTRRRERRAKREGARENRDKDSKGGKSRLTSTTKALLGAGGLWALLEGLPDALHVL